MAFQSDSQADFSGIRTGISLDNAVFAGVDLVLPLDLHTLKMTPPWG
jgi:hypothetical protein